MCSKDIDSWQFYKSTIKHLVSNDKIPKTNQDMRTPLLKERCIARNKHSKNIEYIEICGDNAEQYMSSYSFVDNENYTVLTHTRKEKRRKNIAATLDLHYCTVLELHDRINYFCIKCLKENAREVLIITGKGGGKLRAATEQWFNDHPEIILKYSPIYDTMYEVGSFYVWLRKKSIIFKA